MYVHVNRSYQSRTGSVPDGSYQIHEACLIAALEQSSIQRSDKLNLLSNHCTYASKVIGFSSRFGMRSKSRSSSSFLIGILNLNTRFIVSCAISSWLQACASKAHFTISTNSSTANMSFFDLFIVELPSRSYRPKDLRMIFNCSVSAVDALS